MKTLTQCLMQGLRCREWEAGVRQEGQGPMGQALLAGAQSSWPFIWSAAGGSAGFLTGRECDPILIFRSVRLLFLPAEKRRARRKGGDLVWRPAQELWRREM